MKAITIRETIHHNPGSSGMNTFRLNKGTGVRVIPANNLPEPDRYWLVDPPESHRLIGVLLLASDLILGEKPMKHEHTPGPWWQDDDGCISAGSHETYTTLFERVSATDADVRLAEVAPEMLEALQDVLEFRTGIPDRDSSYLPNLIFRQVRGVINKATGEEGQ